MGNEQERRINAIHGNIYQLKLLMLFLWRGICRQYSFRLGTEIQEANKFDDLVFEYIEGDKKLYRLLQAKHRLNESKKITVHNLLKQPDGDYSLIKYFFSYQDSKKQELFKNGTIKDITICTNIGFNVKELKKEKIEVEKIVDEDDILDIRCGEKQPVRYRFNEDIAEILKEQTTCSIHEIKDYLNHLVFAINQPNEDELGRIIKEEMRKEFDTITTENAYNKLFQIMLTWLQGKNSSRFLSHEEGREFFDEIKTGFPIWFNMKDPVKSFSGRIRELDDLHKLLQASDTVGTSPLVSITGLGGVGKTELTRKYINQYAADYNNNVIWINAESYENLAESFRRLSCDTLGISTKNVDNAEKKMNSIVEDVYKFICRGKSLFVFDNAETYRSKNDFDHGIDKFLSSSSPTYNRPHVLITSRNQEWPTNIKVLRLEVFSPEEAMEFIKMSLDLKNDAQEEDIKELAGRLQFLPLALQQAVAYIRVLDKNLRHVELKFEIRDYLMKYNEKAKELLNFEFPEDSDNDYTRTAFTTWNITLDMIKHKEGGDDALQILYIISYLAPEGIPTDIFFDLISDKEKLASAIALLQQYSMVNSEDAMLHVHRVVQQVIRMHLEKQNWEQEILKTALQLFATVNINSRIINHALSVWNYSNKYNTLVEEYLHCANSISFALLNSLRFEEAYLFGQNILKLFDRLSPENIDPDCYCRTILSIGSALGQQGKYDIALKTFQDALNLKINFFGPNKYLLLKTKSLISGVLTAESKYDEALKYSKEVLDDWQNKLPNDHPEILSVKHDIAVILGYKGEHNKALQILQNIYDVQVTTSGANDLQTLQTESSIAGVLFTQGRYDKSLEMWQKIYNESTLDKNHPSIINISKNIARILVIQGKFSDAMGMYQNAVNAEKVVFGEDHRNVLITRLHIAEVLTELGEYDRALEECQDILKNEINILAPDHLDIACTQNVIACILTNQMKYSDALTIYQDTLKRLKGILGDDHRTTLSVRSSIAGIYTRQGKFDTAFQQYKDILSIKEKNLGGNHLETLVIKRNMGMNLFHRNEFGEALKIFEEVLEVLERLFPSHRETFTTKTSKALVLYKQGKDDEAMKIFREVADCEEIAFGKDYPELASIKNRIASILLKQEKYNEALEVFQEILPKYNKFYGAENVDSITIRDQVERLTKIVNNRLIDGGGSNINVSKN